MIQLNTPVLLIAWRRPNHLKQVIDALRKAAPAEIFIAVDGPRLGDTFAEEYRLIEQTKAVIEKEIDWECDLKKLYREENLGCALGVSSAINWFFEHVEEGVILEDDCLPNNNFFMFCEEMLLKYKYSSDVMHIGGVNYHEWSGLELGDYYHSRYGHIWGWATWRRAWENYALIISDDTSEINEVLKILSTKSQRSYWHKIFLNQRNNPIDTWDYSWQYSLFKNKGYCIYPNYTLVDNIGFGRDATHTITAPKIFPVSQAHQKFKTPFRHSFLSMKFFQNYLDYINFKRAFKSKKMNIYSFNSFLKYLKEKK